MTILKPVTIVQIAVVLVVSFLVISGCLAQCVLTPVPAHAQGYEDFTTYSIIDPEGNLTVSTNEIAFVNVEYSSRCYV